MSELYTSSLGKYELELDFIDSASNIIEKLNSEVELYQNFPNPVKSFTKIPIYSNIEAKARLLISTLKGEQLFEQNLLLEKGDQDFEIEMDKYNSSEQYLIYTLIVADEIIGSRKMFMSSN